jgi:hypothetical protein
VQSICPVSPGQRPEVVQTNPGTSSKSGPEWLLEGFRKTLYTKHGDNKMNFSWKTNNQRFRIFQANLYPEFAKSDYHIQHADEYCIIFNITDPQDRLFDKTRNSPTCMFMEKKYLGEGYNAYLDTELDFADEYAADEFRQYYNYLLSSNKLTP